MRKTIFLLPVGVLIMFLSVMGMVNVNARNQYTIEFYQDISHEIRSTEESISKKQSADLPDYENDFENVKSSEEDVFENNLEVNSVIYDDYLYINNTDICYPLVQGDDNSYYLNHLPDGRKSASGSIFIDYQNDFPEDFNVIIYGHNMRNGTMFGKLWYYFNYRNYAEEHNRLVISYNGARYLYELVGVQRVEYDSDVYEIDPADKEKWIADRKLYSVVNLDTEPTIEDSFITLSTCGRTDTEKVITVWKRLLEE